MADERGSIIAVTDASGNALAINSYDEYGVPASTNQGLFQYTGQAWIPELGMYSYKARIYSPTLGRFLQTDPAGYPDGPNWYSYTMNDPVNRRDPSGLGIISPDNGASYDDGCGAVYCDIVVTAGGGGGGYGGTSLSSFDAGAAIAALRRYIEAQMNAIAQQISIANAQINGGRQKFCFGPPQGPDGISAAEMAAQTKRNGDIAAQHTATDLSWFKSQVQNNGPWDYKQYDRGFQNYGNYNYGYAGTRQGIPSPILRGAAGYAQVKAGTSSWNFFNSGFDDPQDQEQINRGIHDAKNGCY